VNKSFAIFVLVFVLFSCTEKGKDEVIDMSDITPSSDRDYDADLKNEKKDTIDYGFNSAVANELGLNLSGIHFYEYPLFPDRFNPRTTKKLVLMQEMDSTFFCQWSYRDSVATKNAFYNWIDCFGERCKSIKMYERANLQKENFVLLMSDTAIVYISSSKQLKYADWQTYFEKTYKIEDWKLIMHQGVRGKTKWGKIEKGKYIENSTAVK
jgi:hypothetical protein